MISQFYRGCPLVAGVLALSLVASGAFAQTAPNYGAEMPNTGISGFNFPEAETALNGWVFNPDSKSPDNIALHGWGIWTALTTPTGQTARGVPNAPTYLTWATPEEIHNDLKSDKVVDLLAAAPSARKFTVDAPAQFRHLPSAAAKVPKDAAKVLKDAANQCGTGGTPDTCIFENVQYSPPAAKHAFENKLLLKATLANYLTWGYKDIPGFPPAAVAVKPVYKLIQAKDLTSKGLYVMQAWPGTPTPPKVFPDGDWGQCVYVDPKNEGKGTGNVNVGCDESTKDTTYNLNQFIHFKITANNLAFFDFSGGETAMAGDHVILVGMHVATRETARWTWQSFWWTPNPASPNPPSSAAIAAQRPSELTAPAKNYAMTVAYQMLDPAQPLTGGKNIGNLVTGYNPHLEAGFGPGKKGLDDGTFGILLSVKTPSSGNIVTEFGVQTNCMTCHSMAQTGAGGNYGSNFYVSIDPSESIEAFPPPTLKTDFLWSIPDTVGD